MIYIASRVRHADLWRTLRKAYPICSSWIDEAGEGQTGQLSELWSRILSEIRECDCLLLYATLDDFPLKGALIEAGMALACCKRVYVLLPGVTLEERSMRPIGSWVNHPLVELIGGFDDVEDVLRMISKRRGGAL